MLETVEVIFKDTEAQMRQSLAGTFGNTSPAVPVTVRMDIEAVATRLEIEPELAVERFGSLHVRDDKIETIERVNAELTWTTCRPDKASNLGHFLPFPVRF